MVNGSHVVTTVTVGQAENGETQITSGVKTGDKVLEREITFKAPGGGTGRLFGGGTGTTRRIGGGAGGFGGPAAVVSRPEASVAREPADDRTDPRGHPLCGTR